MVRSLVTSGNTNVERRHPPILLRPFSHGAAAWRTGTLALRHWECGDVMVVGPPNSELGPPVFRSVLLSARAKLDGNPRLEQFCLALERACIHTVESGAMPKDLAICVKGAENVTVCEPASVSLRAPLTF